MGIGGGPSIGMMRGGVLNNAGSRGVRGGHVPSGRGSHPQGQPGGHRGGRGGWHNQNNHNRRGAPGGGRGRGSGFAHANHSRDGGVARFNGPSTLGDKERPGKKEEVRQTLTDFRIVGLEIESLKWRWGSCTSSENVDSSKVAEPVKNGTETITDDSRLALIDGVEEIEFGSALQETADASAAPEAPVLPPKVESLPKTPVESSKDSRSPLPGPPAPSPPRIRIYFNTPASLDDSQPKPVNGISNVSANRAKRKLSVEEEEEGRRRRTKLNPTSEAEEASRDTQSKAGDVEKDRDSVAPSVDMSATASVSGRTEDESDWLMEAIGRDTEATEDGNQDESAHQSTGHDRVGDVEVEGDTDGEFTDANHVKEDLGLSNDADTISFEVPTGLADTGNQEQATLSSGDEEKELPAPTTTSIQPIDGLPASQISAAEEGPLLPQDSGPEPEPPASPVSQSTSQQSLSQTLHSSGGSLASPSNSQATTLAASSQIPGLTNKETVSSQHRLPSPNRVSISYASGARRLLIDAQVVEAMKIWRGQGRIEVLLSLERQGDSDLKGLLVSTARLSYLSQLLIFQ
jgi:20S proteasome subunit alpha 6